jgi:hypothetical protein
VVRNSVGHGSDNGPQDAYSSACVRSGDGAHRLRVVGYLRGPRPAGMDCDRPLSVVCLNGCGAVAVRTCSNHRESRCGPCSTRYRLKVRRIASEGLLLRCTNGHQGMLTLTAPSEGEHDGWVVDWDRKRPRPVCNCDAAMVGGLGSWNASAGSRWNLLRGALAATYPGLIFLRAVEIQNRGAIHLHVLVWTPIPLVLNEVQALALKAGFGCVVNFKPCSPGDTRQAHYVSKYVTKATDQRGQVPWDVLDPSTGEVVAVGEAKFRTWSCSRTWGLTMKAVNEGIREAARRRAGILRESPTPATELGEHRGSPACRSVPPD